ncbi:MAG: Methyltransferase type 11 [Thermoleophilia bacterium]|nr:Methyltransferase type 11 [Thermoleophilia bacterium]
MVPAEARGALGYWLAWARNPCAPHPGARPITNSTESLPAHISHNEQHWDDLAAGYQATHREQLSMSVPTWSVFATPESELGVLGDVVGRDVVELGCGAAQFSIALARQGARCTGIDLSREQLTLAEELLTEAEAVDGERPDVSLVLGNVEALEVPDASFDVAFSDYGASMFADPLQWVPEAARVLRPGGRLAFSAFTPLLELCWPNPGQVTTNELRRSYFDLHEIRDRATLFNLPYGEWVRLFRRSGLEIIDLVETRPREGVVTTEYRSANQVAWARQWPAEMIWVLDRR